MKLVASDTAKVTFQINAKEKRLLFRVLELYPLIPATHHRLSKSGLREEDQALLDEALASQRRTLKKQVQTLMKSATRFRANKQGFLFTLKTGEMDWLLQVLNDVRVGSWVALGSPDDMIKAAATMNEKNAPHFLAMEIAGHFQMVFLAVMSS